MIDIIKPTPPAFVEIGGRRIAYDEVAPPNPRGAILLLTGLGAKRLGWYRQLAVFGREYRTIAIDLRDTGDSDPVRRPYTAADLADDAASVLRALGVAQAHIVGISMGGFVALELALRHPGAVATLVLVSTSAGGLRSWPPLRGIKMLVGRRTPGADIGDLARKSYANLMARGYAASHPEDMACIATIARYRPMTSAAYYRQLWAAIRHNVGRRLRDIAMPTLVIHGDEDPLMPTANGRRLAQAIPGARLRIYPQTGHIPIIERAGDFNRDVLAFFADH
jgi:3-oxoadipate enol-lactonase